MANKFINSKWAKVFLADAIEEMPYVKASKTYFADSIKGKKVGKTYSFVLRDSGEVTDDLEIAGGTIRGLTEREVKVTLKSKKNVVGLNVLESITDIEEFKTEVADTYGLRLGAEVQKDIIEDTIFNASTAFVGDGSNNWKPLSNAIAQLKDSRVAGNLVGFIPSRLQSDLTVGALQGWSFLPNEQGANFYGKGFVGNFQTCDFVNVSDIPIVESPTANYSDTGHKIKSIVEGANDTTVIAIENVSGTVAKPALKKGTVLFIDGLYATNIVGMQTQEPFACIVQKDVGSTTSAVDQEVIVQRIDVGEYGARNATGTSITKLEDLEGAGISVGLALNKKYYVAQIRQEKALAYEAPDLDDLVGAENTSVNIGHIKLKTTVLGNGYNMQNISRWDIAYGSVIPDNRLAALAYIPVN